MMMQVGEMIKNNLDAFAKEAEKGFPPKIISMFE